MNRFGQVTDIDFNSVISVSESGWSSAQTGQYLIENFIPCISSEIFCVIWGNEKNQTNK